MRVESSNILLTSARTFVERDEEKEVLRVWNDQRDHQAQRDEVTLSNKSKGCTTDPGRGIDETDANASGLHIKTIKELIVEILSGREVSILDAALLQGKHKPINKGENRVQEVKLTEEERAGWGVEYSYHSSHYEREEVDFAAVGIIRTADGKEIDFSLQLDMSREFISHHNLRLRAGDAVLMDPLVINFNGEAAKLTNMKFSFDIDSDGIKEDVPMIGPGIGFLSLDLNNDGMINNGNELFGPRTDNGFAELSEYDQDENNWIDEDDPVYEQLSIWMMDNQGAMSLNSLKDKGVGAIYLGNISSKFDLRGNNNELMGQIGTTGIYLNENGAPGVVQQLDLVV